MALCRCGESASKPFCDGTPRRESASAAPRIRNACPDRRDTYEGQQVTVLDNRGHLRALRFLHRPPADGVPCRAASRSSTPERRAGWTTIIRAVRACPSGALELRDRRRRAARRGRPGSRSPAIEVSKDGPYRITGGIPLTGATARRTARRGRLERALQPVPLRAFAEQAVLQRHALVHRLPRPGLRRRPRPIAVRVGGRPAGAEPDDPALLREVRARRPAARAALRAHVPGPPASASPPGSARSSAARRAYTEKLRRLRPDALPARRQGPHRGEARPLGRS